MSIDWTKIFNNYRGKWVALKDDESTVIASGLSVQDALEGANKNGYNKPILLKVPEEIVPYIASIK